MSANTPEVEVEVVNNDESVMMNTRQLINNDKRQAKSALDDDVTLN